MDQAYPPLKTAEYVIKNYAINSRPGLTGKGVRKNMIEITDVNRLRRLAQGPGVTCYAIVRSMAYPIANMSQLDVLSPSKDLFFWYRRMEKAGKWDRHAFDDEYVPRFLTEISNDPAARQALRDLWHRSRDGEHIALACYCGDESMCHRSIVAGLLSGTGAEVRTGSGKDYSAYYAQYMALRGSMPKGPSSGTAA